MWVRCARPITLAATSENQTDRFGSKTLLPRIGVIETKGRVAKLRPAIRSPAWPLRVRLGRSA
jgi:hypothetical protein